MAKGMELSETGTGGRSHNLQAFFSRGNSFLSIIQTLSHRVHDGQITSVSLIKPNRLTSLFSTDKRLHPTLVR